MKRKSAGLYAPNIINICIDKSEGGELEGRLYHCYTKEPRAFGNVTKMVEEMETLFDQIAFPQAATQAREFTKTQHKSEEKPAKVTTIEEVQSHRGREGSFLTYVKYRQKSTWQGEVRCLESDYSQCFSSELELLKILCNALAAEKKE